jgi:predicted nucleic acid-binding protein
MSWVNEPPGVLDTNVFIHAHSNDTSSEECRRFILALETGAVQAVLEPIILHELSYALPRYVQQMTRDDVAAYMLALVGLDGVMGEKGILVDTIERWRDTPGLAFADAYLAAVATDRGCPMYSKNVRELQGQGVRVPSPLPAG